MFSGLIAAVFLVRSIFKNHVPKRLIYALWLVVLLKLCLPGTLFSLPVLPAEQAAAADLMHVLEHVDCRACSNQEILTIILDEADAFFQGRKTAQEAARIMDSRAALFIAEAS